MQALHEQQQQDSSSTRSNLKELRRKLFGRSDKDQQQQGSSAAGSSMGPVGPDTSGLAQAGYGTAAAQIDEQTAQQEQLWGELSCAVDGLKARAVVSQLLVPDSHCPHAAGLLTGSRHTVSRLPTATPALLP